MYNRSLGKQIVVLMGCLSLAVHSRFLFSNKIMGSQNLLGVGNFNDYATMSSKLDCTSKSSFLMGTYTNDNSKWFNNVGSTYTVRKYNSTSFNISGTGAMLTSSPQNSICRTLKDLKFSPYTIEFDIIYDPVCFLRTGKIKI